MNTIIKNTNIIKNIKNLKTNKFTYTTYLETINQTIHL